MDGLTEQEIEAKREYHRNWRANNKAKVKAAQDKYYAAHPEKCRQKSAKWRAENPDLLREYVKSSYAKNKEAENARNALYRAENAEKIRLRRAQHSVENKDRLNAETLAWKAANPEKARELTSLWAKINSHKVAANSARRRAIRVKATPEWSDEFVISEIYDLAAIRTKATGIYWQVDHVVPLRSSLVCGLHCEANLRVITGRENSSKGNRFWPDMP